MVAVQLCLSSIQQGYKRHICFVCVDNLIMANVCQNLAIVCHTCKIAFFGVIPSL